MPEQSKTKPNQAKQTRNTGKLNSKWKKVYWNNTNELIFAAPFQTKIE